MEFIVRPSTKADTDLTLHATDLIRTASEESDIAARSAELIAEKIISGYAAVALDSSQGDTSLVGFGYLAYWSDNTLSHSGLVIHPEYRGYGIFRKLKGVLIDIGRAHFPTADVISLTSSPAVRKVNLELGYQDVPLHELTKDPDFWEGCKGCRHYVALNESTPRSPVKNIALREVCETNILGQRCCCGGMRLCNRT